MKKIFTLLLIATICTISFAQERFTEEVYTDAQIKVSSDVQYGTNATILPLLFAGATEFLPEPLLMDVYEPDPSIDTDTRRPMVMVVHGGDGLPRYVNNTCIGDKTDSVTIVTARKLARMGYVAVAPNYRLGWNPLSPSQDAFLDGLVDAAVRVQQDLKACARFLRKDIAEDGNSYGIHPDKFGIWGTSTTAGTYSGFASYITEVEEVQTPTYFVTDADGNVYNVFNEMEAGNLEGTVVGMTADGDTTNYINTPDYSSAFQITALGSAISLDPGIIDADEPPMIMFGNPLSPVTSVPEGPIQLPSTGEVVGFVQLSRGLVTEANEVGINDEWIDFGFTDQYSTAQAADPFFGAQEGWLPLYGDPENEYPWVHWDEVNCPVSTETFESFPGADRDYALSQIDTMAGYFGVRACVTLGLECPSIGTVNSTKETVLDGNTVTLSPNPANNSFRLETNFGQKMETVQIFNISGQLVSQYMVENNIFEEDNLNLDSGFYSVIVRFENGIATKKLVISK